MYVINKITSNTVTDFAAEELKKYLRMMMPECGEICIFYNPAATSGFRLGLMQDFNLDMSDAEDPVQDDILYIDCTTEGGIIAGSNPGAILLAVYEYLKKNDCRWLLPGIDGEHIPMQTIKSVKHRFKPSYRRRGWCIEGALFQPCVLDAIDLVPKLGMNSFYLQFINPVEFYNSYYLHSCNESNFAPEPISKNQALQWKRQCEAEISKRGIRFEDMGHGFNYLPFGIEIDDAPEDITDDQSQYLALINGERKLIRYAQGTQFCMSNPQARKKVVDYAVDYIQSHRNVDFLFVPLADGDNNHCECENCRKKTPSDWYVILLNELDNALTRESLDTKIGFACYVDTLWPPIEEIKNQSRFVLVFCPGFRSYAKSAPKNRVKSPLALFRLNNNHKTYPRTLSENLDYLDAWREKWNGSISAFEYHMWRHQCYDLTGFSMAKLLYEDANLYKSNGFEGMEMCGSQRSFFPNGLAMYTFAQALYDNTLSYEEIETDYFEHLYGKDWMQIRDYLKKIADALPFDFFSRDEAYWSGVFHRDDEQGKKIAQIRAITETGRTMLRTFEDSAMRVHTAARSILWYHADFCDLISDWMKAKAMGEKELAWENFQKAKVEIGKFEQPIRSYYDHFLFFTEYFHAQRCEKPS